MTACSIGVFALELQRELEQTDGKSKYGSHTIDDLAARLDLSKQDVYEDMKIAKYFADDIAALAKENWPRRALRYLVKIDKEDIRNKYRQRWVDGKYKKTDEFIDAVRLYLQTGKMILSEHERDVNDTKELIKTAIAKINTAKNALIVLQGKVVFVREQLNADHGLCVRLRKAVTNTHQELQACMRAFGSLLE